MSLIREFIQDYFVKNKKKQFPIHDDSQDMVGHVGKFSYFEVTMHSIEKENIPHFHLVDLTTDDEICIQILKPEYYKFDRHLTESEIKNLIQWLKSPAYEDSPNYSQYNYICWDWGTNNFQSPVNHSYKMPDYNLLKS